MAFEVLFLIGRILLGGFYLMAGVNHFTKLPQMAEYAKMKNIPAQKPAVILTGILLVLIAASYLFGILPAWGVLLNVIFLVPTSLMMHNFWSVPKEEKQQEMRNFIRNVALLGAALMFLAISTPWAMSLG